MLIGVPLETAAGETRVAVTPETAKKLKAQGHRVVVESGAGIAASVTDAAYVAAGAEITDRAGALGADLVLKVRSPSAGELPAMRCRPSLSNGFSMPTRFAPVFIIDSSLCSGARTFSTRSQPKAPLASVISAPAAS